MPGITKELLHTSEICSQAPQNKSKTLKFILIVTLWNYDKGIDDANMIEHELLHGTTTKEAEFHLLLSFYNAERLIIGYFFSISDSQAHV